MYSFSDAFYHLRASLIGLYDEREAAAIAHEVLWQITGLSKTDRLLQKVKVLEGDQLLKFNIALASLLEGVPLQYVTGEAWFMGKPFFVNEAVLIPRPETEELVQWIIDDHKQSHEGISILDVGTGSGCIPVTLKRFLQGAVITSCDISSQALAVANKNAEKIGVSIDFICSDFLNHINRNDFGVFDVIVSNPPYIPVSEEQNLHINVRKYEPSLALFVPDDDALVFYRALADFGKTHLKQGGYIYCELDSNHAVATYELFVQLGYKKAVLRKDMHGNQRMLRVGSI
jgi:release factor glutamine methyltransferase